MKTVLKTSKCKFSSDLFSKGKAYKIMSSSCGDIFRKSLQLLGKHLLPISLLEEWPGDTCEPPPHILHTRLHPQIIPPVV